MHAWLHARCAHLLRGTYNCQIIHSSHEQVFLQSSCAWQYIVIKAIQLSNLDSFIFFQTLTYLAVFIVEDSGQNEWSKLASTYQQILLSLTSDRTWEGHRYSLDALLNILWRRPRNNSMDEISPSLKPLPPFARRSSLDMIHDRMMLCQTLWPESQLRETGISNPETGTTFRSHVLTQHTEPEVIPISQPFIMHVVLL